MKYLVTGVAGFIGFHLTMALLERNIEVIGIDNLSDYYDVNLKKKRLELINQKSKSQKIFFEFVHCDLCNQEKLLNIFQNYNIGKVINLAAQAGVRYSIENPSAYIQSNLVGFSNLLEISKNFNIKHFVYASSSSVYGGNKNFPFKEDQSVDHPVSLYAATKKSNEIIAHSYSHLFGIPTTGIRFFTVYGPWGRPDMALFLFTKAIIQGKSIKVFNNGNMIRDFTYIDDLIESLLRILEKIPELNPDFNYEKLNPSESWAPFRIFNIGNSHPTNLMDYISCIENSLGIKAKKEFLPMQPGDVQRTESDTNALNKWIGFKPNTSIKDGVNNFVKWYLEFYDYK